MGTCYYLAREDNGTLYDVGKVFQWDDVLGAGDPFMFPTTDEGLLAIAQKLDAAWHRGYCVPVGSSYFADVAADMRTWAEGHPVRFVSENSGLIEQWGDEDLDMEIAGGENRTTRFLRRITGNRYRDGVQSYAPPQEAT